MSSQSLRDRLPAVEAELLRELGRRPTQEHIARVHEVTQGQIKIMPRPTKRAEETAARRLGVMRTRAALLREHGVEPTLIHVARATGHSASMVSSTYRAEGIDTRAGQRAAGARRAGGAKLVLLVDDQRTVLRLGGIALVKAGYVPITAEGGERGLALFSKHHKKLAAVVLDVEMPVIGGEELYLRMQEIEPRIPVIVSTTRTQSSLASSALSRAQGYVCKPWTVLEIKAALVRVGA